jgi:hypothetical protein
MATDNNMTQDEHTSNRTSLGLVLQYFVEKALKVNNIDFLPNFAYYPTFIKPDIVIPDKDPKYSIHVTATGTDASFRMKKWRYIDEIFQMRSIWKDQFCSINVLFGPVAGYQVGDRKLMSCLFDEEIVTDTLLNGVFAYQAALQAIKDAPHLKVADLVGNLIKVKQISEFIKSLGDSIKSIISMNNKSKVSRRTANELSSYLSKREALLKRSPPLVKSAYWKRSLLRLLAIRPDFCKPIFDLTTGEKLQRDLPIGFVTEAMRAKLISLRDGVGGNVYVSTIDEVGISVQDGLDINLLNQLRASVHSDPRRKYELEDLWDGGSRARDAIDEVRLAFIAGIKPLEQLIALSIRHGGSTTIPHHRAHVIDVLTSAVGISQNLLNELYQGPSLGITDPVRNMVPRTELAMLALKVGKLDPDEVAQFVLAPLLKMLNEVNWDDSEKLIERYLSLRAYNLTKGGSVDPLEAYVQSALSAAGWTVEKPAIVSKHPLVGSIKTVFSAVGKKDNKQIVLKCLFGDTGADHKAEEMEARIRLVKLTAEKDVEIHTVFVADGKWNNNNIQSLVLGGWDHVIGVSHLDGLLKKIG